MIGRLALLAEVAYIVTDSGLLLYVAVALITSIWNQRLLRDHAFLSILFLAIVM